ncbi:MAG TPA: CbiX/SirB N-terminal domain-containing protein [Myxococcota bacterium]
MESERAGQRDHAILLVDHGSRRTEANALLDAVAAELSRRVPDRIVRIAHMEISEPTVAQGIDACVAAGAREIVVHPYFLGPGNHTRHSIPHLVEAAASRHPGLRVRISEPLGLHPKLVDVIVERVETASRS